MSGPWDRKYTDEQREAVAVARVDGGRTAQRVAEMAAAGELMHRGEQLAPFTIPANTVYDFARKLERARRGENVSKVAELPHRDALEVLRRRLVNVGDSIVAALEKQAAKDPANVDLERLRQAGRVVVELGRIPAATEPRPSAQTKAADGRRDAPTRGGPAGALLREHRQHQAQTAQHNRTDSGDSGAARSSEHRSNEQQRGEPGALTSEQRPAAASLVVAG